MRNIKQVNIIKAIIHILDSSLDEPVLNDAELEINDEINDFLIKHIIKSSADDEAKCAVFNDGRNLIRELTEDILNNKGSFIECSREIAKVFFRAMKSNSNIPAGDLIICLFQCEYGYTVGILKLDYNKTYIHNIDYVDGRMIISIVPQMIGLPDTGQKLQKCAFINFENASCNLLLLDKQAKKDNTSGAAAYPLNDVLNCGIIKDKRDVTKGFLNTSEIWVRENLSDNAEMAEKVRSNIGKKLKSNDIIDIEDMTDRTFENRVDLKQNYKLFLKENGIDEDKIEVDREWVEKKLKRKRIKIDRDIEIYIDADAYEDKERFEVKRNGDGTINIIIKHVRSYIEK